MLKLDMLVKRCHCCLAVMLISAGTYVYAGNPNTLPPNIRPQSAPINIPPRPPAIGPIGPIRIVPPVNNASIVMTPAPQVPWRLLRP